MTRLGPSRVGNERFSSSEGERGWVGLGRVGLTSSFELGCEGIMLVEWIFEASRTNLYTVGRDDGSVLTF